PPEDPGCNRGVETLDEERLELVRLGTESARTPVGDPRDVDRQRPAAHEHDATEPREEAGRHRAEVLHRSASETIREGAGLALRFPTVVDRRGTGVGVESHRRILARVLRATAACAVVSLRSMTGISAAAVARSRTLGEARWSPGGARLAWLDA